MASKRLLFRLGYFYLFLTGFFGHLLPRPFMFSLAVLVGNVYWAVKKNDREMVRRNLRRVLHDPAQVSRAVRRTFVHYAKYLVDYTCMDLLARKDLRYLVHGFQGKEYIDRAISQGKGGLILTAHLGNWELGGMFLILMGYPLTVITAPDVETRLHDYRVRLRLGQSIKVITLNDTLSSSLSVLKALKDNELVALLGDRDLFGKGIPVEFFGQKVFFPIGPALLAYFSDAFLIPTFVLLGEDHKYFCLAEPPVSLRRTGNRDEDLAVNTQTIATLMERFIRSYPEQWFTFYDFFSRHKAT